jgi:regulator of nucleoside diphosphate kinase
MNKAPSIILTRLDVQRLERLIASLDDATPGIEALQTELDRADQVVGHEEVPAGLVTMNSRVHCREESSGKDYHLKLVYPQDAGADGTVSVLAPVGPAGWPTHRLARARRQNPQVDLAGGGIPTGSCGRV